MFIGKFTAGPSARLHRLFGDLVQQFSIEALCTGDAPRLAREAMAEAGKLRQRQSPLQPQFMFWFTLCLVLFRGESVPAVFDRLVQALRGRTPWLPLRPVTDGALAHARKRLGISAFRRCLEKLARTEEGVSRFHGYRVAAIDGAKCLTQDTKDNERVFGRPKTSRGRCAFPQLLLVVIFDAYTRLPRFVDVQRTDESERRAAGKMVRWLTEDDLLLFDRGFYGMPLFLETRETGAHFLGRAPAQAKLKPIGGRKAKRSGDYRSVITARVPRKPGQEKHTKGGRVVKTKVVEMTVRVIEYRVNGFTPVRLVTSLLDETIPAEDLIQLYHQRWDAELAFAEIKISILNTAKGTVAAEFRSKKPRGVLQEIYALLALYALLRITINDVAEAEGIRPDEIGFIDTVRVVQRSISTLMGAAARDLPDLYAQMLEDIATCMLNRPRRGRRYHRVVKQKVGNFPLKRRKHRELPALDPAAAFRKRKAKLKSA